MMMNRLAHTLKSRIFVLLLFLLIGQGTDGNKTAQAQNAEISSYKVTATNSVITPAIVGTNLTVYSNHVAMNVAGGDGTVGMTSGVGIAGGNSVLQGTEWAPNVRLSASTGTQIYGPLAIANNSGQGPGAVTVCTGLGSADCDVANYSSDADGQMWLTAGTGAASSGTMTFNFSQTWPATPICTLTLVDLYAAWNPGATVKIVGNSQSSLTIAWSNNGVALPNGGGGPGNGVNYHCLALP
jgi:hypothetical protein